MKSTSATVKIFGNNVGKITQNNTGIFFQGLHGPFADSLPGKFRRMIFNLLSINQDDQTRNF